MDINLIAHYKSAEEFFKLFDEGRGRKGYTDEEFLRQGISNHDPESRYAIATYFLDRGADASYLDKDGDGLISYLFGKHFVSEHDTELARRLVEHGAPYDVPGRYRMRPAHWMVSLPANVAESVYEPLYGWFFSLPGLDLEAPNSRGYSPVALARKNDKKRLLLKRMEDYLQSQGKE